MCIYSYIYTKNVIEIDCYEQTIKNSKNCNFSRFLVKNF